MHYVYVLKLNNQTYYTGYTTDLKKRVKKHNKGDVPHTKKFRPIKLIYYSAFMSKKKAQNFEKYLKTGSGIAFRNKRFV
jgi:putative endonuclease